MLRGLRFGGTAQPCDSSKLMAFEQRQSAPGFRKYRESPLGLLGGISTLIGLALQAEPSLADPTSPSLEPPDRTFAPPFWENWSQPTAPVASHRWS